MIFNYQQSLDFLNQELKDLSNHSQEVFWILEFVTQKKKTSILLNLDKLLTKEQMKELLSIVNRRKQKYPLQYLLKQTPFLNHSFSTEEGVLIPREETAVLVHFIEQHTNENSKILEIGVGTGIISISLLLKKPNLHILATDINEKALHLAKKNEMNLLQRQSIQYQKTHLFQDIQGQFDIIVSNPPYISEDEWVDSDSEIFYEPKNALVAEENGLFFYKKILQEGFSFLNPEGFIILELSPLRWLDIYPLIKKLNKRFLLLYDDFQQERALVVYGR